MGPRSLVFIGLFKYFRFELFVYDSAIFIFAYFGKCYSNLPTVKLWVTDWTYLSSDMEAEWPVATIGTSAPILCKSMGNSSGFMQHIAHNTMSTLLLRAERDSSFRVHWYTRLKEETTAVIEHQIWVGILNICKIYVGLPRTHKIKKPSSENPWIFLVGKLVGDIWMINGKRKLT